MTPGACRFLQAGHAAGGDSTSGNVNRGLWGSHNNQRAPVWACIVSCMTHDEWMTKHGTLSAHVEAVRARREELARFSEYIPGPVLRTRLNVLDRLEADLLDQLAALVELDRSGAVS